MKESDSQHTGTRSRLMTSNTTGPFSAHGRLIRSLRILAASRIMLLPFFFLYFTFFNKYVLRLTNTSRSTHTNHPLGGCDHKHAYLTLIDCTSTRGSHTRCPASRSFAPHEIHQRCANATQSMQLNLRDHHIPMATPWLSARRTKPRTS